MAWRMAKSLEVLRAEVNGLYPHRDRTSDGGVGDTSHAARPSKHNPGPDGIVEARDFDEDVQGKDGAGGRPLWPFVQHLLGLARKGHPALGPGAHLIYEGRIWSHARGWAERPYTGPNAHEHHVHVAVSDGAGKDSTQPWGLGALKASTGKAPDRWLGLANPPMRGQDVLNAQRALAKALVLDSSGADGVYGRGTADAVAAFQRNEGVSERGVGPKTWAALRKAAHS